MADFKLAEAITGGNEGGYANNPNDNGGETYAGIARKFWPSWGGWANIDLYKRQYTGLSHDLKSKYTLSKWVNNSANVISEGVKTLVSDFYKEQFWDTLKLDLFKDQQLANTVYDFGVNSGTARAAKTLQSSINAVSKIGISVDGSIGINTISALNSVNQKSVYEYYNKMRESFYQGLAKSPTQTQFLKSWLSRLKPYKLILLIFFSAALFMQSGCGTRKVKNESIKTSNSSNEGTENKGSVKTENSESSGASESTKNDKKNTITTKTTTEKIDSSGRVRERIVQEQTQEKIDKTQKIKNSFNILNHSVDSTFNNKIYRNVLITATTHKKDVVADKSIAGNIKWYGILAGVLLLAAVLFFVSRGKGMLLPK